MAKKEAIERGRALHRLLANDDFAVLLKEWDERINTLASARDNWEGHTPEHNSILVSLSLRLGALKSLREWIDDEVEIGGREKMKQENEAAL